MISETTGMDNFIREEKYREERIIVRIKYFIKAFGIISDTLMGVQ